MVDEILDAFFQFPISMHSTLVSDLTAGLDGILQYYVSKAKSCHGMSEHEDSFLIQLFQYLPRVDSFSIGAQGPRVLLLHNCLI